MIETAMNKDLCNQIARNVRQGDTLQKASERAGANYRTVNGGLVRARRGRDTSGLYVILLQEVEKARAGRRLERLKPMIEELQHLAGEAA